MEPGQGDYIDAYIINEVPPTTAHLIETTPQVPVDGYGTANPNVALVGPTYSHRIFYLELPAGKNYFAFREVGHNWSSRSALSREGGGGVCDKLEARWSDSSIPPEIRGSA